MRFTLTLPGKGVAPIFGGVPVDPLTTKVQSKLPQPLKKVVNPAGPMLKRAVGEERAHRLLDPLRVGDQIDPEASRKHREELLGD